MVAAPLLADVVARAKQAVQHHGHLGRGPARGHVGEAHHVNEGDGDLRVVLRNVCLARLELFYDVAWQHGPEQLHRGAGLRLDAHRSPQGHLCVCVCM